MIKYRTICVIMMTAWKTRPVRMNLIPLVNAFASDFSAICGKTRLRNNVYPMSCIKKVSINNMVSSIGVALSIMETFAMLNIV